MLAWTVSVGLSHSGRGHHLSNHSRRTQTVSAAAAASNQDTWTTAAVRTNAESIKNIQDRPRLQAAACVWFPSDVLLVSHPGPRRLSYGTETVSDNNKKKIYVWRQMRHPP